MASILIASMVRADAVAVWEATANLPAYHIVTQRDVKLAIHRGDNESDFVRFAPGTVTLRHVSAGEPLRSGDVGPDPATRVGVDIVAAGIDLTAVDAAGGILKVGDVVEVLLQPARRAPVPLRGMVLHVSASRAGAGRYTLALALRRLDARRYATLSAHSRITVLRELSRRSR